jgi:hypothetical protein
VPGVWLVGTEIFRLPESTACPRFALDADVAKVRETPMPLLPLPPRGATTEPRTGAVSVVCEVLVGVMPTFEPGKVLAPETNEEETIDSDQVVADARVSWTVSALSVPVDSQKRAVVSRVAVPRLTAPPAADVRVSDPVGTTTVNDSPCTAAVGVTVNVFDSEVNPPAYFAATVIEYCVPLVRPVRL